MRHVQSPKSLLGALGICRAAVSRSILAVGVTILFMIPLLAVPRHSLKHFINTLPTVKIRFVAPPSDSPAPAPDARESTIPAASKSSPLNVVDDAAAKATFIKPTDAFDVAALQVRLAADIPGTGAERAECFLSLQPIVSELPPRLPSPTYVASGEPVIRPTASQLQRSNPSLKPIPSLPPSLSPTPTHAQNDVFNERKDHTPIQTSHRPFVDHPSESPGCHSESRSPDPSDIPSPSLSPS